MRGRTTVVVLVCTWSIVFAAMAAPGSAAAGSAAPASAPLPPPPPAACPVTLPTRAVPPGVRTPSAPIYYGAGALWTTLWPRGRVVFEPGGPGFVLPDGALGMKWGWIPTVPGDLAITGHRLDGSAPPLRSEINDPASSQDRVVFYPTYLIFPTPGCWEVTGRVGAARLTFVTLVVKVGDGPDWRPPTVP